MIRQDFNKQWKIGDVKTAFQALMQMGKPQADVDDELTLPHDAMISTQRSENSPGGGAIGFFTPEDKTYTKTFFVPEADKGKICYVEFEGVYKSAIVRVNGEYAGKCDHGYTDFFVKVNDFIKYGQENKIEVTALNTAQPNSRWYSGTGIYRNVKLLVGEQLHIIPDGLRITTIDVSPELAALRIEAEVKNESTVCEAGYLNVQIKDSSGSIVCECSVKYHVRSGRQIVVSQTLYLKNPKLWDTDSPNLYICEATLVSDDEVIDSDAATFGIRKLQLDPINGLRINGKSIKLKGGCIHHDNGVLGAATFEDAEERRVRLLKEAGYNAIRSAHNPTSKAMLDACDKHGMLVMDEYTDIWTQCKSSNDYANQLPDYWEEDLERFVRRNYNHPSVIMYSIGNEIPEVGAEVTSDFARGFIKKIRSLDSTRLIINGLNPLIAIVDKLAGLAAAAGAGSSEAGGGEINEFMSNFSAFKDMINMSPLVDEAIEESCGMLDIVGYNYATPRYEKDHEAHPNWVFVGTETYPIDLDANWEVVEKLPFVLGDFSWTSWDYLGEAGIGNIRYEDTASEFYGAYPWVIAWCGDIDITGYRRPISYWREIVWGGRNHVPYIAVQKPERYGQQSMPSTWSWTDSISSWTWPGYEGKNAIVEVYSDAEEVELFINGKSQGRKPVGDDFKKFYCKWDTVYEAGKVEAVVYINGQEVGRFVLKTAGTPKIKLTKEKETLRAGSNDLCYVNIELCDAEGTLNTSVEKELTVSIEGPATIQGSGSADPKTSENYFNNTHKTFYGRMLAVVRAGEEKGTARLTVSCDGMDTVTTDIEIV